MLATLALSFVSPALACPTVATGTPHGVPFDTAQVALVRQGTRTTFTVSINPEGDPQDIALVLPVPELVQEADLAVLEPDIFSRLNGYTGVLTMADAGCSSLAGAGGTAQSDADGGSSDGGGGDVQVEAEYLVGGYQITILSASESVALFTWLDEHGYQLPDEVIPVLEEHIEQGMYFMAAQVDPSAAAADGSFLGPDPPGGEVLARRAGHDPLRHHRPGGGRRPRRCEQLPDDRDPRRLHLGGARRR